MIHIALVVVCLLKLSPFGIVRCIVMFTHLLFVADTHTLGFEIGNNLIIFAFLCIIKSEWIKTLIWISTTSLKLHPSLFRLQNVRLFHLWLNLINILQDGISICLWYDFTTATRNLRRFIYGNPESGKYSNGIRFVQW